MNPLYGACRSTRVANFKGVCDVEVDLVVVAADFTINGMCPSLVLDWRGTVLLSVVASLTMDEDGQVMQRAVLFCLSGILEHDCLTSSRERRDTSYRTANELIHLDGVVSVEVIVRWSGGS
ncbi:hypothetical protein BLNAU_19844 [Blattamonas nauphoetae]|uniref:Uncharacterized protein n=1 Tax=Blattamonas nauphoetae TaxID=2049346 RepID=A0ABQ9X122_9EUKA|nr:hypothetical protein BLNAU_19844 [Blattamonas nauphoetae]